VFLTLGISLLADKPWLTRSASDWDKKDAEQILDASPWVRKEAVRIVSSEDRAYRASHFGLFGKKDLYWVRFTWMAAPIQQACELIRDLPADCPVLDFLTAYRALETWQKLSGRGQVLSGENIVILLQGDILSGLIGPHNSQEVETAFLSTETGRQIEASNALFGVKLSSYTKEGGDITGALVEVEDLKRVDQGKQSEADQTPPLMIRYTDNLEVADYVYCVVLIFPRKALGDEDVTVVVPFGGKIGLTPRFRPAEMVLDDKQEL
jgi:hypothetical protein